MIDVFVPVLACGPAALPIAALALTAISTGVAAYSSYQQQKSANNAASYNAAIQNNNAIAAGYEAQNIAARGAIEEKQHRLRVAQMDATQRATSAGSGVVVDSGSPLDVAKNTAAFGELDALQIRSNTAQSVWAKQNEVAGYQAQSILSGLKKGSPSLAAAGPALSGASSMASQGYSYYKS